MNDKITNFQKEKGANGSLLSSDGLKFKGLSNLLNIHNFQKFTQHHGCRTPNNMAV
jgi:hypothetical protein